MESTHRRPTRRPTTVGAMLGLTLGLLALPSSAGAEIRYTVTHVAPLIERAEAAFERGAWLDVVKAVREAFPELDTARRVKSSRSSNRKTLRGLHQRGRELMAAAMIRIDGNARLAGGARYSKALSARMENVRWAVDELGRMLRKRPDDPVLRAYFAEGLSRFALTEHEGREILIGLARRDEIPGGRPLALLAVLQARRGRQEAARGLMRRCAREASRSACAKWREEYWGRGLLPTKHPKGRSRPGPALEVAPEDGQIITIRKGEHLSGLARAAGLSIAAILEANPGMSKHSIEANQELVLPITAAALKTFEKLRRRYR